MPPHSAHIVRPLRHEIGFENHHPASMVGWRALCHRPGGIVSIPRRTHLLLSRQCLDGTLRRPKARGSLAITLYIPIKPRHGFIHESAFHARMFVPGNPLLRGPGNGPPAAAAFQQARSSTSTSRLTAPGVLDRAEGGSRWAALAPKGWRIDVENGKMDGARIGGHADQGICRGHACSPEATRMSATAAGSRTTLPDDRIPAFKRFSSPARGLSAGVAADLRAGQVQATAEPYIRRDHLRFAGPARVRSSVGRAMLTLNQRVTGSIPCRTAR